MESHAFNFTTQETEAGGAEFEGSLIHKASSRTVLHRETLSPKSNQSTNKSKIKHTNKMTPPSKDINIVPWITTLIKP